MTCRGPSRLAIETTWDGHPSAPGEDAGIEISRHDGALTVAIDAPFFGDVAPPGPPGRCAGLWEFEVVELFLVGADRTYLELEFGPHGHYLALILRPTRQVVRDDLTIEYSVDCRAGRWIGKASVPDGILPPRIERWNAFAIHGAGDSRRYLAASPIPGKRPDFHRIDLFPDCAI